MIEANASTLYVRNPDTGDFEPLVAIKGPPGGLNNITQDFGTSTDLVISQAAVTAKFDDASADRTEIRNHISGSKAFDHINFRSISGSEHSGDVPDNSLPSFRLAKKAGFDFVKCNVQMTRDNVPVLFRYENMNTTVYFKVNEAWFSGTEVSPDTRIGDVNLDEILSDDVDFGRYKGSDYEGLKIVTLEQFLTLCKHLGLYAYIEFSEYTNWDENMVSEVMTVIRKCNMINSVRFLTQSTDVFNLVSQLGGIKPYVGRIFFSEGTELVADMQDIMLSSSNAYLRERRFAWYVIDSLTGTGSSSRFVIPDELFNAHDLYGTEIELVYENLDTDINDVIQAMVHVDSRVSGIVYARMPAKKAMEQAHGIDDEANTTGRVYLDNE